MKTVSTLLSTLLVLSLLSFFTFPLACDCGDDDDNDDTDANDDVNDDLNDDIDDDTDSPDDDVDDDVNDDVDDDVDDDADDDVNDDVDDDVNDDVDDDVNDDVDDDADDDAEDELCLKVSPQSATLALDAALQFKVSLCNGGSYTSAPTWSVESEGAGDPGAVDAAGLYTAPSALPEFSTVRIRAQLTADDRDFTLDAFAELTDQADPLMTRDQAVEALIGDYIQSASRVQDPDKVTAVGLWTLLETGDQVGPAFSGDPEVDPVITEITEPAWMFMVDHDPGAMFAHDVTYVFVSAQTGAVTTQDETWFPTINGVDWFSSSFEPFYGSTAVYEGSDANRALMDAIEQDDQRIDLEERNRNHRGGSADDIFPFWTDTVCDCTDPERYVLLIDGMDHQEAVNSMKTRPSFIWAYNMFTKYLDFDHIYYMSTKYYDDESSYPTIKNVSWAMEHIITNARPCDVVVMYFIGHGVPGTLQVFRKVRGIWGFRSDENYRMFQNFFSYIQARNKYLIMEACHSGSHIDNFETWEDEYPGFLNMEIIASAEANRSSSAPIFTMNFYDLLTDDLNPGDDFYDWYEAIRDSDSVSMGWEHLLGRDHAQYGEFHAADTDKDGLVDSLEEILGTDPNNSDSYGDGVCDGDEFRPIMLSAIKRRNDILNRKPPVEGDAPYNQSPFPLPPIPAKDFTQFQNAHEDKEFHQVIPLESPAKRGHGDIHFAQIVESSAPTGLAVEIEDALLVALNGTPTESGDFCFTVKLTDERGASAQKELCIHVAPATQSPGGTIIYNHTYPINARDNNLSLGEALLLAKSELTYEELQPYVDAANPGEQRFVSGNVGANHMDNIVPSETVSLDNTGEVLITGTDGAADGDTFTLVGDNMNIKIDKAENISIECAQYLGNALGPAIHITSNASWVDFTNENSIFTDNSEVGVKVEGHHVRFGPIYVQNSTSHGVWLTGEDCHDNYFYFLDSHSNGGHGIFIEGSASNNVIYSPDVSGSQTGIRLENAGPYNSFVVDNGNYSVEYSRDDGIAIIDTPNVTFSGWVGHSRFNDGNGLLLSGEQTYGASFTYTGFTSNGNNGVLITDGASGNVFTDTTANYNTSDGYEIDGGKENWFVGHIKGHYNQEHGMLMQNGAADNVVDIVWNGSQDAGFWWNDKSGLVFDGQQTAENRVRNGFYIENGESGILFSGGAASNQVNGDGWNYFEVSKNTAGVKFTGSANANSVSGGWIGDAFYIGDGTNTYGVEFSDGASTNTVFGNTIVGNSESGVVFDGDSTSANTVSDNIIHDSAGYSATNAVVFKNGALINILMSNFIEDAINAQVLIESGAKYNMILNNVMQPGDVGVSDYGVLIDGADNNGVGHPSSAHRGNTIIDHGVAGVAITNGSSNKVCGNYIANVDTTDQMDGVVISGGADNTVGGANPYAADPEKEEYGAGNLIMGHDTGNGIVVRGAATNGTMIRGNIIGFDPFGDNNNTQQNGITIEDNSNSNYLGDKSPFQPKGLSGFSNIIGYNTGSGILLDGSGVFNDILYDNRVRFNGDDSAGDQVRLNGGAHGGIDPPTLTVTSPNEITVDALTGHLVQIFAWQPDTSDYKMGALVYSGYPETSVIDLDKIPAKIKARFPEDWSGVQLVATQTSFVNGTSGISEPEDL